MELITLDDVNNKIITIRNEHVLLDSDVAVLYGVETRDINKSVKNNPDKFPKGYIIEVNNEEFANLRWKFSTANLSKTRVLPKAFTEKGLYMLATILKSKQAVQTTIAIIEAFTKMREVSRSMVELMQNHENVEKQQALMKKGGELLDVIIGDELDKIDTETSFELNLAAFKIKHTIKRSRNPKN
ncbi:MAG: ORF6N domain-containing protein [Prevotellaceae bacterium]|jgi:phage regulator Rha-like protein|nr:ORF6N domain-containing protein [Prevotellaceae bacterium]